MRPLQTTLASQKAKYYLIAQEVESAVQGRKASSTYTTEAGNGVEMWAQRGHKGCTSTGTDAHIGSTVGARVRHVIG